METMNIRSDVVVRVDNSCLSDSPWNETVPPSVGPCNPPYDVIEAGATENQWWFLFLTLIPLGTLFGNGLVIVAVARQKNLRNISNRVIASLALTDFLLALFVVPLGIYQLVHGQWNLGLHACIGWTGSDVILSTASIMHLCSIALYRYRGIANPLRGHRRRGVSFLVVPAWTVSIALSIPFIFQAFHDPANVLEVSPEGRHLCGIYNRTFATYSSLVSFFIPLVVMSTVDILSVQTLRRQASLPRGGVVSSSPERITLEVQRKSRRKNYNNDNDVDDDDDDDDNFETGKRFFQGCDRSQEARGAKRFAVSGDSAEHVFCPSRSVDASKLGSALKSSNSRFSSFRRTDQEPSGDSNPEEKQVPEKRRHPRLIFSKGSPSCTSNDAGGSPRVEQMETTPLSRPRSKSLFYLDMLTSGGSFKINGRERRAERTLIWVFAVFVILWLPFFSTNLVYGVCSVCNVPPALFQTFAWLGYLSSGVNPCIYTLLNRDFRTAFHRILTCRRRSFRREIVMSHASVRTFRRAEDWTPPVYLDSYRSRNQN